MPADAHHPAGCDLVNCMLQWPLYVSLECSAQRHALYDYSAFPYLRVCFAGLPIHGPVICCSHARLALIV